MPIPIDLRARFGHVAIHMDNYILVMGGSDVSLHVIFMYNIYTEQWRKYVIPKQKPAPSSTTWFGCAAVIGKECYLFGGFGGHHIETRTNALWKLFRTLSGYFSWMEIPSLNKLKTPSPRNGHNGWKFKNKLWIFGGICDLPTLNGYLSDYGDFRNFVHGGCVTNQLLCFNPSAKEWTNPKCAGNIPSPRAACAAAILEDTVCFYGGNNHNRVLNELYELSMESLSWTQVQTGGTKPQGCCFATLTAVTASKLVLHNGSSHGTILINETWILDLPSKSWKQYESNKDKPRWGHTASLGINKSIIIIGGMDRDHNGKNIACKEHFILRLEPKSLEQLAMITVHKYQSELPVNTLPKKLVGQLGHWNLDALCPAAVASCEAGPFVYDTYIHQLSESQSGSESK